MIRLHPCGADATALLDAIIQAKQPPRAEVLAILRPRILGAYTAYTQARPEFQALRPLVLDEGAREALLHCYQVETVPLQALKRRIKECQSPLAGSLCQYCGLTAPDTFDHYLPQKTFAEFTVHPDNLFPCCGECNRRRGTYWEFGGERQFFNLYFDPMERVEDILIARVEVSDSPVAEFELDESSANNKPLLRLLKSHHDRLNLLERFTRAAPESMFLLHHQLQRHVARGNPLQDWVDEVLHEAQTLRAHQGPNHWKAALYRAVAQSNDFIQFALDSSLAPWSQQQGGAP